MPKYQIEVTQHFEGKSIFELVADDETEARYQFARRNGHSTREVSSTPLADLKYVDGVVAVVREVSDAG